MILDRYVSPITVCSVLTTALAQRDPAQRDIDVNNLMDIVSEVMIGLRLFCEEDKLPDLMFELAEFCDRETQPFHPVPSSRPADLAKSAPVPSSRPADLAKSAPVPSSRPADLAKSAPVPSSRSADLAKSAPVPSSRSNDIPRSVPVPSNRSNDIPRSVPLPSSRSSDIARHHELSHASR
jgi:hypothetical protein